MSALRFVAIGGITTENFVTMVMYSVEMDVTLFASLKWDLNVTQGSISGETIAQIFAETEGALVTTLAMMETTLTSMVAVQTVS